MAFERLQATHKHTLLAHAHAPPRSPTFQLGQRADSLDSITKIRVKILYPHVITLLITWKEQNDIIGLIYYAVQKYAKNTNPSCLPFSLS